MPNHTHLPINRDSGIREDSGLNIPLRGQLRTRLGLTEFPVMPIARPPNEDFKSIALEDADVTDLIGYTAVMISAATAQSRRERSANDWVSSM